MKLHLPLTRRNLLRTSFLAAFGGFLVACGPKPTAAPTLDPNPNSPTPQQFTSTIVFFTQNYVPNYAFSEFGVSSRPREALSKLAESWMATHPNTALSFYAAPIGVDFTSWMETQIWSGEGPDILSAPLGMLNNLTDLGWIVPLNDYLTEPNIYTPDNTTPWRDSFLDPFPASASPHGTFGGVPFDRTATGIYCNLDMLAKARINFEQELAPELGAPPSWKVLLDWCVRLNATGVIPFTLAGSVLNNWLQGVLVDQLMGGLTEQIDVLNYQAETPLPYQQRSISQEELVMQYACNNWQPFSEPALRALCELIKGFSPYLPIGYQNAGIMSSSLEYFLNEQVALLWDGCWQVRNIMSDSQRAFAWDSFWLPAVTTETTQYAHVPPIQPVDIGGFDSSYGINHDSLKRGTMDDCVDWLMYLTTPDNAAAVINEAPTLLPAIKGAAIQTDVAKLFGSSARGGISDVHTWPPPLYWFGIEGGMYSATFWDEMQTYLLDDGSLDDFMAHSDAAARREVPEIIKRNALQYSTTGTWDLTRWPCQPT